MMAAEVPFRREPSSTEHCLAFPNHIHLQPVEAVQIIQAHFTGVELDDRVGERQRACNGVIGVCQPQPGPEDNGCASGHGRER